MEEVMVISTLFQVSYDRLAFNKNNNEDFYVD